MSVAAHRRPGLLPPLNHKGAQRLSDQALFCAPAVFYGGWRVGLFGGPVSFVAGGSNLRATCLPRLLPGGRSLASQGDRSMSDLPRVSHYGTIHIGDLAFDGVVLEDGTRGYIQKQIFQAIGFHGKNPSNRFRRILGEVAPNALNLIAKSESPVVVLPHGGHAAFLPVGVLCGAGFKPTRTAP